MTESFALKGGGRECLSLFVSKLNKVKHLEHEDHTPGTAQSCLHTHSISLHLSSVSLKVTILSPFLHVRPSLSDDLVDLKRFSPE